MKTGKSCNFLNLNLRNNLRKTKEKGLIGNLRFYLRKTKGEGEGLKMFLWREKKNLRYFLTVIPQVNNTPPVILKFFLRFSVSSRSQPPPPPFSEGKTKRTWGISIWSLIHFPIVRMCLNQNALFIVYAHLAAFGRYPDNIPLYIISTYKYM